VQVEAGLMKNHSITQMAGKFMVEKDGSVTEIRSWINAWNYF